MLYLKDAKNAEMAHKNRVGYTFFYWSEKIRLYKNIFSKITSLNCYKLVICCFFKRGNAPVAQLDRALPSGGRSVRFESYRARHVFFYLELK